MALADMGDRKQFHIGDVDMVLVKPRVGSR